MCFPGRRSISVVKSVAWVEVNERSGEKKRVLRFENGVWSRAYFFCSGVCYFSEVSGYRELKTDHNKSLAGLALIL